MTYYVKRETKGRWLVLSPFGDQLNVLPTCGRAKTFAGCLAGWRGKVVVL